MPTISKSSHYYLLSQPNPPKLFRHSFTFFTFYYTIFDNRFYPIAISKPNSTQLPHYFLDISPSFDTLQQLLNHYTNPLNNPLK